MLFQYEEDAFEYAESQNATPRRDPLKVYAMSLHGHVKGYVATRSPLAAVSCCFDELGVGVRRCDPDELPLIDQYVSKLTLEQIEEVRALLAR